MSRVYGVFCYRAARTILDRQTTHRKRQLVLRFEQELDRYLRGEVDQITLERRETDTVDHLVTRKNGEYKRLDWAA